MMLVTVDWDKVEVERRDDLIVLSVWVNTGDPDKDTQASVVLDPEEVDRLVQMLTLASGESQDYRRAIR
jgi:hypothetical protein